MLPVVPVCVILRLGDNNMVRTTKTERMGTTSPLSLKPLQQLDTADCFSRSLGKCPILRLRVNACDLEVKPENHSLFQSLKFTRGQRHCGVVEARLQSLICLRSERASRDAMHEIQLHNTLSGKIEPFVPLKPGHVGMYTCGPTVYDYAHIGNYRTFVFQDILRRFLKWRGFQLNHVMNLTDVDDRIIANSAAAGWASASTPKNLCRRFSPIARR